MRDIFAGYYAPTKQDLSILWKDAIFVFDTNVLLHLYRVPAATRDQLIAVLRALDGRLWLPRHVGIEFQRRRLDVIHTAHSRAIGVLGELDKALSDYQSAIAKAELVERGVNSAVKPMEEIGKHAATIRKAVENTLAGQLSPMDDDTIRDVLDGLFGACVGPEPTQETVLQWDSDAKVRFEMKRGPGYEDAEKSEGQDPAFYAHGIVYQRAYGDLYLWFQILEMVRSGKMPNVVFVTQDNKEDWWMLAPGKAKNRARLAPREYLVEEIKAAGAERFWMYQLDTFLVEAPKQLKVNVTPIAIKDVQRADAAVDSQRPGKKGASVADFIPVSVDGEDALLENYVLLNFGPPLVERPGLAIVQGGPPWDPDLQLVITPSMLYEVRHEIGELISSVISSAPSKPDEMNVTVISIEPLKGLQEKTAVVMIRAAFSNRNNLNFSSVTCSFAHGANPGSLEFNSRIRIRI